MITFHCWNPNFLHCSQFSNTSYTLQSEEHGFMKRTEVNSYYLNIPNPDRSLWTSRSCENYRKLEWNTSYLERNNVIWNRFAFFGTYWRHVSYQVLYMWAVLAAPHLEAAVSAASYQVCVINIQTWYRSIVTTEGLNIFGNNSFILMLVFTCCWTISPLPKCKKTVTEPVSIPK